MIFKNTQTLSGPFSPVSSTPSPRNRLTERNLNRLAHESGDIEPPAIKIKSLTAPAMTDLDVKRTDAKVKAHKKTTVTSIKSIQMAQSEKKLPPRVTPKSGYSGVLPGMEGKSHSGLRANIVLESIKTNPVASKSKRNPFIFTPKPICGGTQATNLTALCSSQPPSQALQMITPIGCEGLVHRHLSFATPVKSNTPGFKEVSTEELEDNHAWMNNENCAEIISTEEETRWNSSMAERRCLLDHLFGSGDIPEDISPSELEATMNGSMLVLVDDATDIFSFMVNDKSSPQEPLDICFGGQDAECFSSWSDIEVDYGSEGELSEINNSSPEHKATAMSLVVMTWILGFCMLVALISVVASGITFQ